MALTERQLAKAARQRATPRCKERMVAYRAKRYADPAYRQRKVDEACAWQAANRERKAAYDKARRDAKGDALRSYDKERASAEHRRALKREWSRKRKMTVAQATPLWTDPDCTRSIYRLAAIYTEVLGQPFEVDHIEPLHGESVSGLHVPANLQVLPALLNHRKRNHPSSTA